MIQICVQKTVLNNHEFHEVTGEHLLYDLVERYLGYSGDQSLVTVGDEVVPYTMYKNVIIEPGDMVYMTIVPKADWTAATWFAIASIGVSLWAGYRASRMTPPDSMSEDEKLQFIQGLRNEVRKYQPIPMVIGEHRVTPDFAAMPYTEVVGDKQYYNILFNGGYAPQQTSDFRIGDTDINQYEEVEIVHYNGYDGSPWEDIARRWPNDVVQETVDVEMEKDFTYTATAPVVRTLATDVTSAGLDFSFPQGLIHFTDEGKKMDTIVWIQADYSPQGSSQVYRPCRLINMGPTGKVTICTGDVVYQETTGNYYILNYIGRGTQGGVKSGDGFVTFDNNQLNNHLGKIDVTWLVPSSIVRPSERMIHLNITPWLDLTQPPIELTLAGYTVKKSTRKPFFESIRLPELDRDRTYDVSVRVLQVDGIDPEDGRETLNDVVWNTLTGFRPSNAQGFLTLMGMDSLNSPYRPVLTYVRIKATNQLNGMLDKFNYLAKTVVPSNWEADWSVVNTSGTVPNNAWARLSANQLTPTDNPAHLYRAMLQGPWNAKALPNDRLNLDDLTDWRDLCIDEGYRTSAFKRDADTLQNELNKIAFTGRAEYALVDGKYSVSVKTRKPIAVQLFTNKNSWDFSSSREFPEDTDGLKFQFYNREFDYEQDEGRFINPDKTERELRDLFTTVDIPYVSDAELATKHARFIYWSDKLQREVYSFRTDIENLRCTRGDRIKIQNDIIEVGLGSGRVTDVHTDSNTGVMTFTLDETIGLEVGVEYTLTVRPTDGFIITSFRAVYIGEGQFQLNTGNPIEEGYLVSYGTNGKETLDCTIVEIDYTDDHAAQITCVNYAPEVFDIDDGPVPPYTTNITPKVEYKTPAAPTILLPSDPAEYAEGTARIRFRANARQDAPIQSYSLEAVSATLEGIEQGEDADVGTDWEVVGVVPAGQGYIDVELDADNYWQFRARALGSNDLFSPYSEVVSLVVPTGPSMDVEDLTLQELVNTPKSANADLSTIIVRVIPPDDPKWGGAMIQYKSVDSFDWHDAGRIGLGDARVSFIVNSDGSEYEVRAISVSKSGVRSTSDVVRTITVYNVDTDTLKEEIEIPTVTGLELYEQALDTEFLGGDAYFVWNEVGLSEWFQLGNEPLMGADYGGLDLYFRDYEVQIWANNKMVHLDHTTDPQFLYTYDKNSDDYLREEGEEGAYREFTIRVYVRGRNNQKSARAARLTVSNPPPGPLRELSVEAGFGSIDISYQRPTDRDFAGVRLWLRDNPNFDPATTEPYRIISDNSISISGLEQGKTYYVVLQPFDDFGIHGAQYSPQYTVTTHKGTDLEGLSGWAYQIDPVDRDFINEHLEGDAIPSEKIANLTVAKLTGGVINATETITSEGIIRAVDNIDNPTIQVGIGPVRIDNTTYLNWAIGPQGRLNWGITDTGDAYFNGRGVFRGQLILDDGYEVDSEDDIRALDGNFIEFRYRRSDTKPATPTAVNPTGWELAPPAGTGPLWMVEAKKVYDGSDFSEGGWSEPVRFNGEDGQQGPPGQKGDDGVNGNYIEFLYRRSPTQPATPTAVNPSGWSFAPPSGTDPLWMIEAKKIYDGSSFSEGGWSTPVRINGEDGQQGPAGQNGNYVEFRYRRAATQPATPTAVNPSGWELAPPQGTNPLWIIEAKKVYDGSAFAEGGWSTPVRFNGIDGENGKDGKDGKDGADGAPGPAGPPGQKGDDGVNGAGIYSVTVSAYTSWGNIAGIFQTQYGRPPVNGDTVSQVNSAGKLIYENQTTPAVRTYDGSSWISPRQYIAGNLIAEGSIIGDRLTAGTEITAPVVTLNTTDGGAVRANKTDFDSTVAGFWLGMDGNTAKLNIGNSSNYIQYDGTELVLAVDRLGAGANSSGENSISLGKGSSATGKNSTAVGVRARATNDDVVAIGTDAGDGSGVSGLLPGAGSVQIGYNAFSPGEYGIALGEYAQAKGSPSMAMGTYSEAVGEDSIAIGSDSFSGASNTIAIGTLARGSAPGSVSIGTRTEVSATSSVAIGSTSTVAGNATGSVSVGSGCEVRSDKSYPAGSTNYRGSAIAIGSDAKSTAYASIAIGATARSPRTPDIFPAEATGNFSIVLGVSARSTYDRSCAIGAASETTAERQIRLGDEGIHVSIPGDLRVTGNITANYSDERLKDITETLSGSLDAIKSWNSFKYTANDLAIELSQGSYSKDKVEIGLSAQDVQRTHPELVTLSHMDEAGGKSVSGENYLTLDYTRIVAVLVDAIKEQNEIVEGLERRIRELEEGIK